MENAMPAETRSDFDISVEGSAIANISRTPGEKILEGTDFISRITNLYYGYSTIPGNYFQQTFVPDINALKLDQINYVGGLAPNITACVQLFASGAPSRQRSACKFIGDGKGLQSMIGNQP